MWYYSSMAKKTTLKELGEMLSHVVDHMATKGDIGALNETLSDHSKILAEHTRTFAEQTKTLAAHTRDLNIIKSDVERNLDKRLQLEVRTGELEKKVFGAVQDSAHQ
jgi:hypothetical protein